MRAKTINEEQNFERGLDPRASMDIGGIDFGKQFAKMSEEWEEKVKKSIEGKTITASMTELKQNGTEGRTKKQTAMVKEVDNIYTMGFMGGNESNWNLVIETPEGVRYSLTLDQKIYIK
jgi:hypothetical protein